MAAPKLTPALKQQLDAIEPSHYDPQIALHPCSVQLRDGRTLECVYMTEASVFKCLWHFDSPEEVPGMFCISPAEVVSITDSPFRLPARFANKVYQAGESGMGYTIFALNSNGGRGGTTVRAASWTLSNFPHGKVRIR